METIVSIIKLIKSLFSNMEIRDGLDILMVGTVFFLLFVLLRHSRNQVALRGLIVILVSSFVVYLLTIFGELSASRTLLERLWIFIALVFLISFQNEFRRALTDFGRLPLFRVLFRQETEAIEEIIKAVARLSEKRVGALICLERRSDLRSAVDKGTDLDAQISSELIRTIFAMYTPLHDGAVIIRNNRIVAAGCLLPLSRQDLPKDLGTRHRAALGLAEETDGVVIVVSEETGTISLTYDSQIDRPETPESLRTKLFRLFEIEEEDGNEEAA
ncbi:MAG: diadenylate cyclase CdaA [Sumerlaeia bacterium]